MKVQYDYPSDFIARFVEEIPFEALQTEHLREKCRHVIYFADYAEAVDISKNLALVMKNKQSDNPSCGHVYVYNLTGDSL